MSSLQAEFRSTSLLKVKRCSILECGELNLLTLLTLVSIWCTITNILNPYLERKIIHIPGFTAVLLTLSMIWKLTRSSLKYEWIKFVCIYLYTHTHTHTNTHTHRHIYIYTHTYTHTHICTCTYTHTHIYIHICTCTYVHVYTHIHTYIHTMQYYSAQRNEILFL